jgi:hypothetical protein
MWERACSRWDHYIHIDGEWKVAIASRLAPTRFVLFHTRLNQTLLGPDSPGYGPLRDIDHAMDVHADRDGAGLGTR